MTKALALAGIGVAGALAAAMTLCAEPDRPSAPPLAPAAEAKDPKGKPRSLEELLKKIEPLEPAEALKKFQIEPGFRIELVAAEPDVFSPIALAFDEHGRMYVAEDREYPLRPKDGAAPVGRIRLLEDTDGDGRVDRSLVFADGLQWPSGIAVSAGGIYVLAPPQLLYLKDTDGDGRADVREVVYDGFGTGSAEDIANNLKWGLDNRIYGASSYNGGDIVAAKGERTKAISIRNRDFRFDPATRRFEPLSGTGDFGNCFDDFGNRFVSNAGQLLIHAVLQGPYLARNPNLVVRDPMHRASASKTTVASISEPEPWRVARKAFWDRWVGTTHDMRPERFSSRELAERGMVTGAAGCEIYRGDLLPGCRGDAFVAECAGNVVVRLRLQPRGATFDALPLAEDREFLASQDNWFRPVNIANGPEGALYVMDMYRELIEDPSAIPEDILKHFDLTRDRNRGRLYRIVPANYQSRPLPKLAGLAAPELVALLASPNAWTRETAQRLLVERRRADSAFEPDPKLVAALRQLARNPKNPQGQVHALGVLAGCNALDAATVQAALESPHEGVRVQALQWAELFPRVAAIRAAVRAAAAGSPHVRLQAACTLGNLREGWPEAVEVLAEMFARDAGDRWISAAVLSSIGGRTAPFLQTLIKHHDFLSRPDADPWVTELAEDIALERNEGAIVDTLALFGDPVLKKPSTQAAMLSGLANGLAQTGQSFEHYRRKDPRLSPALAAIAKALADAHASAVDGKTQVKQRVAAIRLLHHDEPRATRATLDRLLTVQEPPEVQLAAVQILSRQEDDAVAQNLLRRWAGVSPGCRREMLEALMRTPGRIQALFDAVDAKTVAVSEIDADRRALLLNSRSEEIRKRAHMLFASSTRPRRDVIERFQASLKLTGDAQRGGVVFKLHCTTCHRLGNEGHRVGPDLASVRDKGEDALLTSILDPSREVSANYVNYVVTTSAGRTLTGLLAAETAAAVVLRRAEGIEDTIPRADIEEIRPTGQSIMPEGLEERISLQEMADLLSFLKSGPAKR